MFKASTSALFTTASGTSYNGEDQATISYDAATNSYTYSSDFSNNVRQPAGALTSYTFTPADRDAANSTASFAAYQATDSAGKTRLLRLLVPGASNPTLALTYTSAGYFAFAPQAAGVSTAPSTNEFFYFGQVTPVTNLPASGTGAFTGINQGLYYDQALGRLYQTSGTTTLSVNFATGAGTVNFGFTGVDINNAANLLGLQSFTGSISGSANTPTASGPSAFAGMITGPTPTFTGTVSGAYFGPSGQEFGFTYLAGNTGPGIPLAWGVSVGKRP